MKWPIVERLAARIVLLVLCAAVALIEQRLGVTLASCEEIEQEVRELKLSGS